MTKQEIQDTRETLSKETVHHPLWKKAFIERNRALSAVRMMACSDPSNKHAVAIAFAVESALCEEFHGTPIPLTAMSDKELDTISRLIGSMDEEKHETVTVHVKLMSKLLRDWIHLSGFELKKAVAHE